MNEMNEEIIEESVNVENTMEYNSGRQLLKYPEFGRHVQSLVQSCATMEDKEERQAYIQEIVDLVVRMNPEYNLMERPELKVWQKVFNLLGEEIELDYPEEIDLSPHEERFNIAHSLEYPKLNRRYRQHGGMVQKMIEKAIEIEDEEKRMGYLEYIGSYMKLAHRNWNKENFIHDDVIKNEIKAISKGKIDLTESDITFDKLNSVTVGRNNNRRSNHKRPHGKTGGQKRSNNYKRRKK